MYRMTVESEFSAAHAIRGHHGPCCQLHGHNYRVVVELAGTELDELGMLVDYADVKAALARVLARFDHAHLNALDEFADVNPTSEQIARLIYQRLAEVFSGEETLRGRVQLTEVVVYENERQGAGYGEA